MAVMQFWRSLLTLVFMLVIECHNTMNLYMYDHHGEKGPCFILSLVSKYVFQSFDYYRLSYMKMQTKQRRVWPHQTISYYNNATSTYRQ